MLNAEFVLNDTEFNTRQQEPVDIASQRKKNTVSIFFETLWHCYLNLNFCQLLLNIDLQGGRKEF